MIRLPEASRLFTLVCIFSPSIVLARGRGGGGGGSGGASSNFSLEPIVAAIFSFCIIFAIFTAFQALQALSNLLRRINRNPPSITLPEFSVGPIFPAFLLLSTSTLTTAYVLHGVYWGIRYNENASPSRDSPIYKPAYPGAWSAMEFLADIFLVSGILALINHRENVVTGSPKVFRDTKMVVDALLTVILIAFGMAITGVIATPTTNTTDFESRSRILWRLSTAYTSFFFVAVIDIAVSSLALYIRSKRSLNNGRNIPQRIAFIISPFLFLYALYPVLLTGIENSKSPILASRAQWDIADLVIGCVTEFIVIATCLGLGMPAIPKKGANDQQDQHIQKGYQA